MVMTDRILPLLRILPPYHCSIHMMPYQPDAYLCIRHECNQQSYWSELLDVCQLNNVLKTVHQVEMDQSDQETDDMSR